MNNNRFLLHFIFVHTFQFSLTFLFRFFFRSRFCYSFYEKQFKCIQFSLDYVIIATMFNKTMTRDLNSKLLTHYFAIGRLFELAFHRSKNLIIATWQLLCSIRVQLCNFHRICCHDNSVPFQRIHDRIITSDKQVLHRLFG